MSRAWIAFYMGDYQKKTQHLDTLQHGAYFLLLQHCWTNGSIPAEPASRAAIARMPLKAWQKIAPIIDPFFDGDGRNKRASEEIEKAEIIRTKRAIAGKQGGYASGISKAIAMAERSKRIANAKQITQQTTQQKPSISEAIHNSRNITTTVAEDTAGENGSSLATALPAGALREPPNCEKGKITKLSLSAEALEKMRKLTA